MFIKKKMSPHLGCKTREDSWGLGPYSSVSRLWRDPCLRLCTDYATVLVLVFKFPK